MDQYRGYTVAGMFLVNFVGGISAFHYVLKHNNGFFSYADSIMPGFIFCAGFSYRLTAIRRFAEMGTSKACWSYVKRSLALVLVSVSIFTFNADIGNNWNEMQESIGLSGALAEFVFKFLKSGMWEVLSIIGMTQILLLPFIYRGVAWRVVGIIVLPLLHLIFSWSFNYDFANGFPNWFNSFFGAHNGTVWDGGLFGILAWSLPMLAGALTYDLIAARTAPKACGLLMAASLVLMAGGYLTNCLSRLYDENPALQPLVDAERESLTAEKDTVQAELESLQAEIAALKPEDSGDPAPASEELKQLNRKELDIQSRLKGIDRKIGSLGKIALDPVIPSMERLRTANWGLADLPFVKPEREKQQINYWLMDKKRMVSLPFTLFSTGFALFLYSLFIILVDVAGLQLGVLRTLGQNPLAAYIIHEMLLRGFGDLNPDGAPLQWGLFTFAVFFAVTWMMVRYLEKNRLFLRL
jgi:predicted acyltransferase